MKPSTKCWVAYFKRRPSREDDRWLLVLLKSPRDQLSGLAGRTSLFASFPSTSYWATFTKSLRDESSAHTPTPYIDAHGRRSQIRQGHIEYLQYVIWLCTNQSLNLTQSSDSFAVFALVIPFLQGEQIPTQGETLSEKYCRRQSNG